MKDSEINSGSVNDVVVVVGSWYDITDRGTAPEVHVEIYWVVIPQ
jgi:hypothetical protein